MNGELMERKVHENVITLLEVRAKEIVFGSTMRQKSFVKEAVEKAELVGESNDNK